MAGPIRIAILANGRQARAEAASTAASLNIISKSASRAGKILGGAFAVGTLGAVAVKVGKIGASYVDSLNKVQALTGATDKQMASVAKSLESQASSYARFGQTTGDAAKGMVELTKSGLSANKALAAIKGTMTLAKAGELEVADASELVANTLNTFNLKASQAADIANSLANAANISSADVRDVAESFKYVAPLAAKANVSVDQTNALLAELANSGIKASQAGTSLRKFLLSLQAPTGAAKDAINKLGVSVYDAEGKMRPIGNLIEQLRSGLDKLSQKGQNEALRQIFGLTGITGAQVILKGGVEGLKEYTKGVKRAGAATELAESASRGLKGTLVSLRSRAVSAAQSLYRQYSPALDGQIQNLTNRIADNKDEIRDAADTVKTHLAPALSDLVDLASDTGAALKETAGPVAKVLVPALEATAKVATLALDAINALPGPVKTLAVQAGLAALVFPRLSSGIATATTSMRNQITYARVLGLELQTAEGRSRNLAAAMTRMSGAARTAAGVGGLVALTQAASTSNKGLQALGTVGGGALLGFSVGGPVGAAVGGTVGALISMKQSADRAKDAMVQSKQPAADYASTLDKITGAATGASRSVAKLDLQRRGAFEAAAQLGISGRDVVSASLGNEAALKRVNAVLKETSGVTGVTVDAFGNLTATLSGSASPAAQKLSTILGTVTSDLAKQGAETRRDALLTQRLADVYKGVPRDVITRIRQIGGEVSLKQLRTLARQVELTPKSIRIIARQNNIELTAKQVRNLSREVESAGKAKPNLAPALRSVQQFALNAKRAAQSGSQEVASTLKKGTGRAKANLDPFNASLTTGLRGAQAIASSGGRQSGNALGQGLYNGVDAWAGPIATRAASIVTAAVNAAKAAGKIKSPSQVMRDEVGLQLGRGIAIGLQRSQPEVKAASFGIVEALVAGLSGLDLSNPADSAIDEVVSKIESLYDKRLDRATTRIGRRFDQLGEKVKGQFKATDKAIEQWEKRAEAKARKSLKGKALSKALRGINNTADRRSDRNDTRQERAERALEKAERLAERKLTKQNKADRRAALAIVKDTAGWLRASAAGQAMINAKLEDAKNALDEIRQKHADYVAQVRDNVVSFGSIIGLGEGTGFGSVNQMLDMLRAKVSQARDYAELIKSLTAAGLNQTTLQQLIDAGVEGGLGTARAIASGGAAAIAEINSLTADLEAVGTDLGTSVADNLYGAGITAAEGLVDGLTSMAENAAAAGRILAERLDAALAEATALTARKNAASGKGIGANLVAGLLDGIENNDKAIAKAASKLGNALVRKVKEELGIRSPSRVFRQIGDNVAVGLVQGIDARDTYVKRSASSMARTVVKSGTPALDAWNAAGGGGSVQQFEVQFSAEQMSDMEAGRKIRMRLNAWDAVGGRVAG